VSFGPCQANILRGSEPQAVAHKNRVRVILPEATGACCDRSSRLSEPRAVAHLPGLFNSARLGTAGTSRLTGGGGFSRREVLFETPPLCIHLRIPPISESVQTPFFRVRVRPHPEKLRKTTVTPKLPCPPKSSSAGEDLCVFFPPLTGKLETRVCSGPAPDASNHLSTRLRKGTVTP
jgi:hypothetical protein